jgi:hypothetical protein
MKFFREQGAYTNKEIGEGFSVGYTAVTGTILWAEKQFRANKDLKRLVEEIIEEIKFLSTNSGLLTGIF